MKRFMLAITCLGLTFQTVAQDYYNTTQPSPRKRTGLSVTGFSGGMMEFSRVKGNSLLTAGGGGAALFNKRFFVGGFGQRTLNPATVRANNQAYNLHFTTGGLWAGYLSKPGRLLTFQVDTRLGWTRTGVSNTTSSANERFYVYSGFMATPTAGVQINVAPFARINLSGGYRFATNVDVPFSNMPGSSPERLGNADFNGAVGSISVIFGSF